jgi:protein O-mannosyl-transferase
MTESRPSAQSPMVVAGAFAAVLLLVLLVVYGPALRGGFVSDDIGYVVGNPWIHELSLANVRAILDPLGPAAAHTANWAPLHLLLHAVDWRLFGADPLGHHVVNVALHAVASALLVALFARYGAPLAAAAVAGAVFALHPANVEAVAWIFQLKSIVALALATTALLLEPRRPFAASVCFALALLAKIQAAFALPVAAVAVWCGAPAGAPAARPRAAALAGWAVLLGLAFLPELLAFERLGHADVGVAPLAGAERWRMTAAIVGRYLEMAATTRGLSAFQQPDVPVSWLDPHCLVGILGTLAMAARALVTLFRRRTEAVFWAWVAGGFLPISQLLPFLYPIADRYLYFVLPGLLGAALCAAHAPLARLARAPRSAPALAALAASFALLVFCGARSYARAAVWKSDLTLSRDSAAHFPNGLPALMLRAQSAAAQQDVAGTVAALHAAGTRGFDRFIDLEREPFWEPLRGDARFQAAVAEIAGVWIGHVAGRENPTVPELRMWGLAHAARGEWDDAIAKLERAQAIGGPGSEGVRADLAEVKAQRMRAVRAAGRGDDGASAR